MVTMASIRAVSCIVRVQVQAIQLWWLVVRYSSGGSINVCCNFVCMYYSVQHISVEERRRQRETQTDTTTTATTHRQTQTQTQTRR